MLAVYLKFPMLAALAIGSAPVNAQPSELTVHDVRTLPTDQLARSLLGERLGSRVIDAVRSEYGSSPSVPRAVEFYTQPQAPWPRINRICQTDVISVEYNWFDVDAPEPTARIGIAHVVANPRFLAFPEPPGEPGTPEYDRAHRAACAAFQSARDAFRAPDAGDAQWLAQLEAEWVAAGDNSRFSFTCQDYRDITCQAARRTLPLLRLHRADDVRTTDCPVARDRPRYFVTYCYRLSFRNTQTENLEWVMTVVGGMRNGSSPVETQSLHLQRTVVVDTIH